MAELFHYKCTECTFEIFSTPWGGDIYGSGYGYELFKCNDCKSLVEVEKGYTERAIEEIRKRHEFKQSIVQDNKTEIIDLPTCTKCRSTNLSRWSPENCNCPVCGSALFTTGEEPVQTD